MAILKTYSIDNNTLLGIVNVSRLHAEIDASGAVNDFDGVTVKGDSIFIEGVSISNENLLDRVLSSYGGSKPDKRLNSPFTTLTTEERLSFSDIDEGVIVFDSTLVAHYKYISLSWSAL